MGSKLPFVSVITPVYNSAKVIGSCLEAVALQDYPKELLEVIVPDGGSNDRTREIIDSYSGRLKIIHTDNPLKTGEAGKSAGIEIARGEIIALIDSDNIMPAPDFIRKMVSPFSDEEIFGTEPLYFECRNEDPVMTRYFALAGINDPLCLFIGNYDRYSYITGKWTGLEIVFEDKGDYLKIALNERKIPTIGANGTFLRKSVLSNVRYKPYFFDIDAVYEIVKSGINGFAKVKTGIVHLYSGDMASFVKKQSRRVSDFLHFEKKQKRSYPWGAFPVKGIVIFCFACLFVFPLLFQAVAGFIRRKSIAWIFHIPVCYVTLFVYALTFIKARAFGEVSMKSRDKW